MICIACKNGLSPDQMRVIKMHGECMTDKEIAVEMGLRPRTVEYHIAQVRKRLNLPSREHLVHWALFHKVSNFQV